MKYKKIIFFSGLLAVFLFAFIGLIKPRLTNRNSIPIITLKGKSIVDLTIGSIYEEDGYTATDQNDGNITKQVRVISKINYDQPGTYVITYKVKNSLGKKIEVKRYITIKRKQTLSYQDSYDLIDNKTRGWWSGNNKDHTRPLGGADINELRKYNAYFIGADEKKIYLTFDEGSNDTYLKEIADVLNRNDVDATFFLCKRYMQDNPDLMRSLVKNGHSVGNHTAHHVNMPEYANKGKFQKYLNEIEANEKIFLDITGTPMDKIYREPKGEWSYRSLQIIHDLGYKSYFWSADYLDWDSEKTKKYALEELLKRHHNGAIYLIHPKAKGNLEAMDSFIRELKKLGYSFDLVKNISQ